MSFFNKILFLLAFSLSVTNSHAALTIEISEGVSSALPVAVVPFSSTGAPVNISTIINADLERCGYFKMMAEQAMPSKPNTASAVNFNEWQSASQNYLVIGQLADAGNGQYNVQYQRHKRGLDRRHGIVKRI